MPFTINGVGTHYYGKSNVSTRSGTCESCGREGALASYDTRLWIVVLFVPIIPIGRKRIVDYCSSCTRHRAANADEFNAARAREIQKSRAQFDAAPTPEAALELHAVMLAFGDHAGATAFRQQQQSRFADDAEFLAVLGAQLEEVQQSAEALQLYAAAYRADPQMPLARLGAGKLAILEGRLPDARKMLSFLEEPGAADKLPMGPLLELAAAYQQQGQHETALQLTGAVLREVPALGQQYEVRQLVRKSEQQVGGFESQLPPAATSWLGRLFRRGPEYPAWQRWVLPVGLLLILVLGGMFYSNDKVRRHRRLHVTNAFNEPVQVQIDDQPAVPISGLGSLPIAEGKHQIRITGAVNETHEVVLSSGFFARWTKKPVWVLNPGGAAAFVESEVTYSSLPVPPVEKVIVGEVFFHRADVDYPFSVSPAQMQVKSRSEVVKVTQLEWKHDTGRAAFEELALIDPAAALKYAEASLQRSPERADLLEEYAKLASQHQPREQLQEFLHAGARRGGVEKVADYLEWHRLYQSVVEATGETASLIAEYDQLLAERPDDARLLYLRGRIEADWPRQQDYYSRAIAAAPDFAWPHFALAYNEAEHAHWPQAVEHLQAAERLAFPQDKLLELRQVVLLGAGSIEALAEANRQLVATDRQSIDSLLLLTESLAAAGQQAELTGAMAEWKKVTSPAVLQQVQPIIEGMVQYMAGDFQACDEWCQLADSQMAAALRTHLLLALNDPQQATTFAEANQGALNPSSLLALSVAWDRAGNPELAQVWRARCCELLTAPGSSVQQVASALESVEPVDVANIEKLTLPAEDKALFLAGLGLRHAARRDEYFAAARRFNVRRIPPYHQVRQILEGAAAEAPPEE